jgi:hypothetical protein
VQYNNLQLVLAFIVILDFISNRTHGHTFLSHESGSPAFTALSLVLVRKVAFGFASTIFGSRPYGTHDRIILPDHHDSLI